MVNVFLVIVAVVLAVVILVVSGLLIVNFSHPDDRNVAIFPKLVTLLGLFLASATVLLLPFDVANTRGSGGGIRMDIVWQVVFILDAIFLLLLLPFAFFYYESDEDPETS
jgi:LMBR1 domain-containing protein 1